MGNAYRSRCSSIARTSILRRRWRRCPPTIYWTTTMPKVDVHASERCGACGVTCSAALRDPFIVPVGGGDPNLASVTRYTTTPAHRDHGGQSAAAPARWPAGSERKNIVKRTRAARRAEDEAAAVAAAWSGCGRTGAVACRAAGGRVSARRPGCGRWWLDADVVCIDDLAGTLSPRR